MKKLCSWFGLAVAAASFVACDILPVGEFGRLMLTATSDGVARSLAPQTDLTVASYDFFGSGPNATSFEYTDVRDGTHSAGGLLPGEWMVTAVGKNADGTEIVEATVKAEVKVSETTKVTLLCEPSVGNGTLDLQISWPDGLVASPSVQATLVSADDSEKTIPIKIEPSAAGIRAAAGSDAEVTNGSYTLSVELQDTPPSGPKSVWGVIESVLILKGAVTTGSWTLDAAALASGGISIDIGSPGSSPFKVTFSGGEAEILQGYPQTISASSSPEASSWRWYRNGTPISGQEGKSPNLTLQTSSLNGAYRLSALVRRGSDRGFGSFSFRVYPNDSDFAAFSGLLAGYACNGASVKEVSKGVFTLSSGPGVNTLDKSELAGRNKTNPGPGPGEYLGGKAFLGLPHANGVPLTSNFRIAFRRNIDSHPANLTDPSVCMYFNLIVDGTAVHNSKGGTGVLVAATPAAGQQVVLDGSAKINNISGGTIDGITKNVSTLADLVAKNVKFVNAVTNDNGTPIGRKLAAVLIIVGDSRGKDSPNGNMSNVVMTVSDVEFAF